MTLAEMFMAWRLWFTRGLLNTAQRWHSSALIAQMRLQEREEDKWHERRNFADNRIMDAEDGYDAASGEYAALNKGKA